MAQGRHLEVLSGGQRWRDVVAVAKLGQSQSEVRRFPMKEAAIGQGATNVRPARPKGQAEPAERLKPSGERESGWLGK
jgi:hypothetical protein